MTYQCLKSFVYQTDVFSPSNSVIKEVSCSHSAEVSLRVDEVREAMHQAAEICRHDPAVGKFGLGAFKVLRKIELHSSVSPFNGEAYFKPVESLVCGGDFFVQHVSAVIKVALRPLRCAGRCYCLVSVSSCQ